MSCTTCGSNANCGCIPSIDPCGGSPGGSCGNSNIFATPQPYYACAPACQESNTKKVVINQFSQALKVANSWNVPACGLTATLSIPGLVSIVIGSYLWNETYGYFEVTAFDSGLQQVTVINNCNDGNAASGTAVPSCTEFINVAPPAADEAGNTPCVEIDFTAPAVSACIDITLNNTTGITAGDTVQIGSGFYYVDEVKPNDIINICNQGDGITPGTAVIAKDANGNYQYCLQIISTSPCERDVVTNGAIIVCNSSGQTTVLEMPEDGWVFEGTSGSGENFVGAIPIGLEPFCTRLSAPLSIVAGTANYNITVNDSTGYLIGDIIQVAGYPNITGGPDTRFTITGLPNPSTIVGTFSPVPATTKTMPTGTNVCRIGCCELLSNEIDALTCQAEVFRLNIDSYAYSVPVTLDGDNYFEAVVDAAVIPVDISGADCLDGYYAVEAHLSIASNADFSMVPADLSELGTIYHEIEANWSVGGVNGRNDGKIVYTDVLGDSRALSGFPNVPEATFDILPAPGPNFPLNYHQNDVTALAILPPGTTATTLGLSYRTLVGDFEDVGLSTFDQVDILISGWVKIYKING